MSGLLEGKVVLVTGGSTGIGRASSLILAREGATVVVADVQDAAGADTVAAIGAAGGRAEYRHCDVGDDGAVKALVNAIAAHHGSLDGAFNNAGIEGPTARITDVSLDDWSRVMRVNLTGVFLCLKHEISQMMQQGRGGAIVSTASAAGLVGIPGSAGYNAAKHGVVGLTKTVALEYASRNIRVNAVCPGFIQTPMLGRLVEVSAKIRDHLIGTTPMRRVATPEEIGEVVAWLLSERASFVTGVAMPVDGGLVAQ